MVIVEGIGDGVGRGLDGAAAAGIVRAASSRVDHPDQSPVRGVCSTVMNGPGPEVEIPLEIAADVANQLRRSKPCSDRADAGSSGAP
jgi:hypothetical protein